MFRSSFIKFQDKMKMGIVAGTIATTAAAAAAAKKVSITLSPLHPSSTAAL